MKPITKNQLLLTWVFYKSTLTTSICISVLLAVIGYAYFFKIFGIAFMTAGPLLSLLYKEVTEADQYYFYYNRGLSKLYLILASMGVNIVIGLLLLIIGFHGAHPGNR